MKVTVGNFEQCQTPLACLVGGVTIAVTRPEQGQGDNGMGTVMIITSVDTRNMMTGSHQSSATIHSPAVTGVTRIIFYDWSLITCS